MSVAGGGGGEPSREKKGDEVVAKLIATVQGRNDLKFFATKT